MILPKIFTFGLRDSTFDPLLLNNKFIDGRYTDGVYYFFSLTDDDNLLLELLLNTNTGFVCLVLYEKTC